ncbi:hypothetical protein ADS79_00305 [Brevibacillus reuszeri]|uniref:Uncharacterized protein n=1 Tax=Brevibacillus reuszeri TaxID=54915 RepID=A0A0K9Z1J6_9BACL|nr:hypothetical protein ADS79_00305 [Brevibacillus reuszeri]
MLVLAVDGLSHIEVVIPAVLYMINTGIAIELLHEVIQIFLILAALQIAVIIVGEFISILIQQIYSQHATQLTIELRACTSCIYSDDEMFIILVIM